MKPDLSVILEGMDAGILVTDRQGRVLYANSTFRKLSGWSSGPGLSKPRLQELQALLERAATPIQAGAGLKQFREQEREHILKALDYSRGKIYGPDGAAAHLSMPPTTLVSRLRKYGIPPKRRRTPPPSVVTLTPESDPEPLLD